MAGDSKTMQFKMPDGFFKAVLKTIENMRDETWSDITLKVGFKSVFAHRVVLAAHCGYFRTLFLGNFSDSKTTEMDLSSVIEDADILDRIIRFIYCGMLESSDDEFWEVARLASYFEIEILMEECQKKMKEKVTLSNSIEYFMFAHSHGYHVIDSMTSEVIGSRFHDYFAFQESTLDLRPGDLKHMLDLGYFRNCGNAAFLGFLGNWVASGGTYQYVEVAKEVVDYLDMETEFSVVGVNKSMTFLEDCCSRLESKLGESDTEVEKCISFLKKFKSLVSQLKELEEVPFDGEEDVLFTIVERKKKQLLLDPKVENESTRSRRSDKKVQESVFQIFVFRPKSNCWYQIHAISSGLLRYNDRLLPIQQEECKCFVVGKVLICASRNSNHAMKFDLEKNEWSRLTVKLKDNGLVLFDSLRWEYRQLRHHNWNDIGNHFALSCDDLYVIFVKPAYMDDYIGRYESYNIHGCSFQVCKVDVQDGSLTDIASTPVQGFIYEQYLSDLEPSSGLRSSALVLVNRASGEMLVLAHIDSDTGSDFERYYSFVVNIIDGSVHFFPEETNDQLKYPFKELYMVKKPDCFLIIRHFEGDCYEIVAEYKFLSEEIVFRAGVLKPNLDSSYFSSWLSLEEQPGMDKLHYGGGEGLWCFSGYWNYTCDFRHIPLSKYKVLERNADGNIEGEGNAVGNGDGEGNAIENSGDEYSGENENKNVEENQNDEENETEDSVEGKPPPFANVKCVWEVKMNKKFLKNHKPVTEFLL